MEASGCERLSYAQVEAVSEYRSLSVRCIELPYQSNRRKSGLDTASPCHNGQNGAALVAERSGCDRRASGRRVVLDLH